VVKMKFAFGYVEEMDIVVTEDGCEVLNEMDRELRIIPI